MEAVPLKRLLDRQETELLLAQFARLFAAEIEMGIVDVQGRWVAAYPGSSGPSFPAQSVCEAGCLEQPAGVRVLPIVVEQATYGALCAGPIDDRVGEIAIELLVQVLGMFVQRALVQKSLAGETLDRYREINLLYRAHETIGSSLDLDDVVEQVLQESTRIIKAHGGVVLLPDPFSDRLAVRGWAGIDVGQAEEALIDQAFSEKVFHVGRPGILNNLHRHVRTSDAGRIQLGSLLSAPLKDATHVIGVVTLGRTQEGAMFTAGDEKLLMALASQAAVAIANAREVEARERKLRQQIEALRIEIDESKKQREVFAITESEYFAYLKENAQKMRAEFDI
jgi:hypothetical protein